MARAAVVRWLAVVLLAPLLSLGTFGGLRLFAHSHDGHGFHFHAAKTDVGAVRAAAAHRAGHEHGSCLIWPGGAQEGACGHGEGCACSAAGLLGHIDDSSPEGILIVLPDHDQLLAKRVDLNGMLAPAGPVVIAMAMGPPSAEWDRSLGFAGATAGPSPACPLSSTERLVRTSCALLL